MTVPKTVPFLFSDSLTLLTVFSHSSTLVLAKVFTDEGKAMSCCCVLCKHADSKAMFANTGSNAGLLGAEVVASTAAVLLSARAAASK